MRKLLILLSSGLIFVSCSNSKTTSSNSNEFTSLDRKTFLLYGEVTKVVTSITRDTDKDGFATESSLNWENELNFDSKGNLILAGEVKRDSEGKIIYWNEFPEINDDPDDDRLHQEEWKYLPNGNVSTWSIKTYYDSTKMQYRYDANDELLTIVLEMQTEEGPGKDVESYKVLEKDNYGNWISRIVKVDGKWEYEGDITTYRKETRKITYK